MSTGSPRVSVCVPLYQKERYVADTIRSVLDQTFGDFELVVLNNASTDDSAAVVEGFSDSRISLHHNENTVPGRENLARLMPLAASDLVKMVAADDRLHPTALEEQVAVMDAHPDVALVSCRQNMIDADGTVIYRDRSLRTPDLIGHQTRTAVLRRLVRHVGNPIGALANVLFRRSALEAAGGIPEAEFSNLDVAMWLAALEHGHFFGMKETLVDFRIADGSASVGFGQSGISNQIAFIDQVCRANADEVRRADLLVKRMRTPLMRLRHTMIVAAGGPESSPAARAARRLLGMTR